MSDPDRLIAFQGVPGANSDMACRIVFPELATLACESFEETLAAVRERRAKLAMIPIENSLAGRVADIHHLMPDSGLHIIAEHFQRINHHLLAPKGAKLEDVRLVHSHVHALNQCRRLIAQFKLKPVVHVDTAGAAADVASGTTRPRPRSPPRSPARSTACRCCAPTSRTPSTTPRASS